MLQNQEFESRDVVKFTGVTERELRHWADRGIIRPDIHDVAGRPGIRRRYSFENLVEICIVKALVRQGLGVHSAGRAVEVYRNSKLTKHFQGPLFLVIEKGRPSIWRPEKSGEEQWTARLVKMVDGADGAALLVLPIWRIRMWLSDKVRHLKK